MSVNITFVGPVVTEKDGKQIVDSQGRPSAYFAVGFAQPFAAVRRRNMWGRLNEDGEIAWERLSPEQANEFRAKNTDLSQFGVRLVSRDVEPFTPEGLDNPIDSVRLVVFPDETESQALRRLYGPDARFKGETVAEEEFASASM